MGQPWLKVILIVLAHMRDTQQNSYSVSHLLGTVTTLWLDSDYVVTVDNCRLTVLQMAVQSQCCRQLTMVPTLSLSSHSEVTVQHSDWWNRSSRVLLYIWNYCILFSRPWIADFKTIKPIGLSKDKWGKWGLLGKGVLGMWVRVYGGVLEGQYMQWFSAYRHRSTSFYTSVHLY